VNLPVAINLFLPSPETLRYPIKSLIATVLLAGKCCLTVALFANTQLKIDVGNNENEWS
jgi:hypothetical protein